MNIRMVHIMSAKDNIHFPDHVNLVDFLQDFQNKSISARKIQEKYEISPRQYRLIVRYFREKTEKKPKYHKSPRRKYIYRDSYGLYVVRKRVEGVFKYFGAYRTLDEAIKIRDMLVESEWDMEKVKIVCI